MLEKTFTKGIVMADTYPPDFDSPVGIVRSLIRDVNQFDYDSDGVPRYRVSDAELGLSLIHI